MAPLLALDRAVAVACFAVGVVPLAVLDVFAFASEKPAPSCNPKKRGPDQCAPVMARAMAESERWRCPRHR